MVPVIWYYRNHTCSGTLGYSPNRWYTCPVIPEVPNEVEKSL